VEGATMKVTEGERVVRIEQEDRTRKIRTNRVRDHLSFTPFSRLQWQPLYHISHTCSIQSFRFLSSAVSGLPNPIFSF
jgi:hypothetical protein